MEDKMNRIYEIIKIIIPVVITGFVTYWVTKYNRCPIDKIAISYNRIYYPLLQVIKSSEGKNYKLILEETKKRLQKYNKYASRTTIAACKLLEDNIDSKNAKNCLRLLEDDIYKYNSKFRRMLGYPEPMFIFMYKYLSSYNKALFTFYVSISICVLAIYAYGILEAFPAFTKILLYIIIIGFIILCISVYMIIYYNIKYTLQKLIKPKK